MLLRLLFPVLMVVCLSADVASQATPTVVDPREERLKALEEREESRNLTAWGIGIAVGILGSLGFSGYVWSTMNNKVKAFETEQKTKFDNLHEELKKEVRDNINAETSVITDTFAQTKLELQLKTNTKIRILQPEVAGGDVDQVLRAFKVNLKNITTEGDYDLLLIDNQGGRLASTKEELAKYVTMLDQLGTDRVAFYYNDTNLRFPSETVDKANRGRLNFATNPSQLYSNLLGSLFYLNAIKP